MTEIELYKFIQDNSIEWHWQDNDGVDDVVIFPYPFQIEEFAKMVESFTGDGGMECRLMGGYFAFWMKDLCEHYDIDIEKVFDRKLEP